MPKHKNLAPMLNSEPITEDRLLTVQETSKLTSLAVSTLNRARVYEQHYLLHDYVHNDVGVEISNRMGWLLDDLLTMLADIQNTLYPKG